MSRKPKEPELVSVLKRAILELMNNKEATAAEKLKAIELGTKLAAIEAKIKDVDDGKSFFGR